LDNPREELVLYDNVLRTIKFYQAHNGIKIQNAQYYVHFNKDWKINGANGHLFPMAKNVNTTPAVSKEGAEKIAIADFEINPQNRLSTLVPDSVAPYAGETELMLSRIDGEFRLVWNTGVTYGLPWGGGLAYVIDAQTGEIIHSINPIIH
jgi:Zn-dependent metalloprotease